MSPTPNGSRANSPLAYHDFSSYIEIMIDEASTARALAALGNETRLHIYRLLVRAGDGGLSVGEVAHHMDMAPSTLAHHLGALVDARLVTQERHGRTVTNRADYDIMRRTIAFLSEECCTGVQVSPNSENQAA